MTGSAKRFSSIGVFQSVDGGGIWTSTGLSYANTAEPEFSDQFQLNVFNGTRISKIVFDPYTEGRVYAIIV